MLILHVITGLNNGGAEGVLFRLVTSDKQNEYQIISLMDLGIYGNRLIAEGIAVYCINMSRGSVTLKGLIRLFHLIRHINPDVVQTWMYHADLIGGIVARFAGIRTVVWNIRHSNLDSKKNSLSTRLVAFLCALLSRIIPAKIVSCSEEGVRVHNDLGYLRDKMVVIPNGFDIAHFFPSLELRNSMRNELGIKINDVLIGMVARWDPQKDHATLIGALSMLYKSYGLSFNCLLVGPNMDSSNTSLNDLLNIFGVADRVILLGPRSDIPAIMNSLDLHCSSSCGEGFPNVVAEAMACGVPCVVTDVGDARLIVGETGWCVPPENSRAFADAVGIALHEMTVGNRTERSALCRQRIVEKFSIEKMLMNYIAVWEKMYFKKKENNN